MGNLEKMKKINSSLVLSRLECQIHGVDNSRKRSRLKVKFESHCRERIFIVDNFWRLQDKNKTEPRS